MQDPRTGPAAAAPEHCSESLGANPLEPLDSASPDLTGVDVPGVGRVTPFVFPEANKGISAGHDSNTAERYENHDSATHREAQEAACDRALRALRETRARAFDRALIELMFAANVVVNAQTEHWANGEFCRECRRRDDAHQSFCSLGRLRAAISRLEQENNNLRKEEARKKEERDRAREERPAHDAALRLVSHLMVRVRNENVLAWEFCRETFSLELLIEAYCALTGAGLESGRKAFVRQLHPEMPLCAACRKEAVR